MRRKLVPNRRKRKSQLNHRENIISLAKLVRKKSPTKPRLKNIKNHRSVARKFIVNGMFLMTAKQQIPRIPGNLVNVWKIERNQLAKRPAVVVQNSSVVLAWQKFAIRKRKKLKEKRVALHPVEELFALTIRKDLSVTNRFLA